MYPTQVSNLRYAPFDYMKKSCFHLYQNVYRVKMTCRLQFRAAYTYGCFTFLRYGLMAL